MCAFFLSRSLRVLNQHDQSPFFLLLSSVFPLCFPRIICSVRKRKHLPLTTKWRFHQDCFGYHEREKKLSRFFLTRKKCDYERRQSFFLFGLVAALMMVLLCGFQESLSRCWILYLFFSLTLCVRNFPWKPQPPALKTRSATAIRKS